MKKPLIIIFSFLLLIHIKAQEKGCVGLYMRTYKEMKSINPSTVIDSKADVSFPGWEKPVISLYINKEYSENRTTNRQPEFFFFFPNESDTTSVSINEVVKLTKNYPFVYAKSPKDFLLIRLFKMKNKRAYRMEKEKVFSVENKFKTLDIDTIPSTIIPISNIAYKVILDSQLPAGEYGFIYKEKTPYKEVVYDFGCE